FKHTLAGLSVGGIISASSLAGDFVMPKDTRKKLAFIAGGIGVTPFASMARHCIASEENRDAILLYASKKEDEAAYRGVFDSASRNGWRAIYRIGAIDAEFIKSEVPDYSERIFYISGPPGFVTAMKNILLSLGVSRFSIKTDFFPGLA
ncbi:MAG: FAD-dependent oxidoreductase, partial [Candidatus Kaiserbacteria bacterium]|nr:FAD-dependent oxidoreductase [Candidatus Kaiserbacteria bacterium]